MTAPHLMARKPSRKTSTVRIKPGGGSPRADTVAICNVSPQVEGGRYPAKRVVGEVLKVSADIFKDGHDELAATLRWRRAGGRKRHEAPMTPLENDRWQGECVFDKVGDYRFEIVAWMDEFLSWRHDFQRRVDGAQENLSTEIREGVLIAEANAERAADSGDVADSRSLHEFAERLAVISPQKVEALTHDAELEELMLLHTNREFATITTEGFPVMVERPAARFSAWYEFFPRSAFGDGKTHATFRDCLPRLDDARDMGFDVVYLPPVHPIGESHRKGRNNTVTC